MKKNSKKSQVAKRVTKKLHFMTAEVTTNDHEIRIGQKIKGTMEYVDEDNLRIIQQPKQKQSCPERKYRDITGSLHGKISLNANGVTLHMYIRHSDYQNEYDLADIIEREVELMCGDLADKDLKEEVAQCC